MKAHRLMYELALLDYDADVYIDQGVGKVFEIARLVVGEGQHPYIEATEKEPQAGDRYIVLTPGEVA